MEKVESSFVGSSRKRGFKQTFRANPYSIPLLYIFDPPLPLDWSKRNFYVWGVSEYEFLHYIGFVGQLQSTNVFSKEY